MDASPTQDPKSDEQLAELAQLGSDTAFEVLVQRYQIRLMRYLLVMTRDQALAEDAFQETFLSAFQSLHTYRSKFRFSTWIYTIARRALIKLRRHTKATSNNELDQVSSIHKFEIEDREISDNLWSMIRNQVSENAFTAVWMLYAEDESIETIARILGKTKAGTKMLLVRTRRKIRSIIEKENLVEQSLSSQADLNRDAKKKELRVA